MTFGAALMFVFAVFVAAMTVSFAPGSSLRIIFLVIAWLALTVLINIKPIIQYFLREENNVADEKLLPSKLMAVFNSEKQNAALPSAQSIPADFMIPAANTAEMAPPPSVTESTTNLLSK